MSPRASTLFAFASMISLALACGGRQPPPQPTAPPTPDDVVAAGGRLLDAYRAAYEQRSLEALAPLYVHGLDVVVTHQGQTHRGWTAVETYLDQFFTRATVVKTKAEDVKVTALGTDAATVTARLQRTYGDGVTSYTENGTLSLALIYVEGSWRILGEHYSYR